MSYLKRSEKVLLARNVNNICRFNNKGLLAADESINTIQKRFDTVNIENTKENRTKYRNMLLNTPGIETYIGGIILHEETLEECKIAVKQALDRGIHIGVKIDQGLQIYDVFDEVNDDDPDQYTSNGLEGLKERIIEYKKQGCTFGKFRCVFEVNCTPGLMQINCVTLAKVAKICQENAFVPIIEPEVLMTSLDTSRKNPSEHTYTDCQYTSERVLSYLFHCFRRYDVLLQGCILKTNMVVNGSKCKNEVKIGEYSSATTNCLLNTVPQLLGAVVFLSGGLTSIDSITLLGSINNFLGFERAWPTSFSFGRAIQAPVLEKWAKNMSDLKAQEVLLMMCKKCSEATIITCNQ